MLMCLAEESLFVGCCSPGGGVQGESLSLQPLLLPKGPVCSREHAWEGGLGGEVQGQGDTGEECGGDGHSGSHPALLQLLPVPPSSDDV